MDPKPWWRWRTPRNPGFVEIGQRIDAQDSSTFYEYLQSFGYGAKTGIELPGEAEGIAAILKPACL